jgi:hypothetical protein
MKIQHPIIKNKSWIFLLLLICCVHFSSLVACKSTQDSYTKDNQDLENDFYTKFIESFEFIDFYDMCVAMAVENSHPWTRYDNDQTFHMTLLERWRRAKKLLMSSSTAATGAIDLDLVLRAAQTLSENPNFGIRTRDVTAGGDFALPEYAGQQGFFTTNAQGVSALKQSPYLTPLFPTTAVKAEGNLSFARYDYPSFKTWKKVEVLLSAPLRARLQNTAPAGLSKDQEGQLTQAILTDLMTQLLAHSNTLTSEQFYQRFIAIHPFSDVNGRTGRLLYWFKSQRRPLILRNFDIDILTTEAEFSRQVQMQSSQWNLVLSGFQSERTTAKAEGRVPDFYHQLATWAFALNRSDILSNQKCTQGPQITAGARQFFDEIEIKQRIDKKDFYWLENKIAERFSKVSCR